MRTDAWGTHEAGRELGDDRSPSDQGFEDQAAAFERQARVRMMDDASLLYSYRVLSNARLVKPSPMLALLEEEIRSRGLAPPN